eukprot:9785444-Alexandrium_andersonii.AAC.1
MSRVAFSFSPDALRALGDLVAWHRATRDASEAFGRQGGSSTRASQGPRQERASQAGPRPAAGGRDAT